MFQENLRLKRRERGLSQEELASRLHVVRQTISKWEKGQSVPDAEQLINTQLAIRNHRTRRVLKIIAVALLAFAALVFAIMALNYAPMPLSK